MKASLLALVLALCCSAIAAEKETEWQNLSQLRVGQRVEVVATNLVKYKGEFVRFDDMGVTLLVDKHERTIVREQVARVSSLSHRVRNGVLLGVAGLVTGGMTAGRVCGWTKSCSWDWLMPLGMAGGAAAGAAIPSGKTYFRVKRPDPTK